MSVLQYILILIIVSCGKATTYDSPNDGAQAEPLYEKVDTEVFRIKYDNQIFLDCSLSIQKGKTIPPKLPSSDKFSWKLTENEIKLRILRDHSFNVDSSVTVKIKKLNVEKELNFTNVDGLEYRMRHSPVLSIQYTRTSTKDGDSRERRTTKERTLFENIETRIYSMTSKVNGNDITEEMKCKLQTYPKNGYKDQWKKEKPKR